MSAPRLKLLKVLVQPVFVLDDGTAVSEVDHPVIAVPASEWAAYSGERFPREVGAWQKQLDAEHAAASIERSQVKRARRPKR